MLGARVGVVQAPIWNVIAYLLPLPDKKKKKLRQLWLQVLKQADWAKMLAFAAHTSYQKKLKCLCACV